MGTKCMFNRVITASEAANFAARKHMKVVEKAIQGRLPGMICGGTLHAIEERWYYMDKTEGRKGPVTRDHIMELKHKKDVDDATFVWHEATAGLGPEKNGWVKYGSPAAKRFFKTRRRLASRRSENRPIHTCRLLREIRR